MRTSQRRDAGAALGTIGERVRELGRTKVAVARAIASLVTLEHQDRDARVLVVVSGWPRPGRPAEWVFVKRQMDSLAERGMGYETLFIRGYRSILAYPIAAVRLWAMNARRPRYRLVHVHGGEAALAACLYRRAPLLISYLGGDVLGNSYRPDARLNVRARIRRCVIRQTSLCAAATITKSSEMEDALPQRRRKRNAVIPNGVDMAVFHPSDRAAARAALGWRPDERIALFVGNPAELRKRYSLAAAAVDQARASVNALRLAVVHGIEPERAPVYMNAADCLLHLSWMEGSPNVVKEALMCNLPIIATAVGDIEELLAGIEPSFVVAPTPGAVARALMDCLGTPRRSNGRARSGRLALDSVAGQVLSLYDNLAPQVTSEPGTARPGAYAPSRAGITSQNPRSGSGRLRGSPVLESAFTSLKDAVPRRYRYPVRGALLRAASPLFVGREVECPCCSRTSRRWISIGAPYRLCPRCSSGERHRLLALYLHHRTSFETARLRVVHFAPEYCLLRRFRQMPNLDYVPADLDPPRGAVRLDLTEIQLPSASVDVAICSHVLEHVPDDATAMRELRRIIKPGGQALLMVPVDYARGVTYEDPSIVTPAGRRQAFNQVDHVRIYGRDFEQRLRSAGFRVECYTSAQLQADVVKRCGLPPAHSEVIYACRS